VAAYEPRELLRSVGRRVRELRAEHGLTQNELAMRMKSATQWVQTVERGSENLTLYSLARLANGFEVSIEALFSSGPTVSTPSKAKAASTRGPRASSVKRQPGRPKAKNG